MTAIISSGRSSNQSLKFAFCVNFEFVEESSGRARAFIRCLNGLLYTLIGAVGEAIFRVILLMIAVGRLRPRRRCLRSVVVVAGDDRTGRDGVSGVVHKPAVVVVVVGIVRLLRVMIIVRCGHGRVVRWIRRRRTRSVLDLIRFVVPIVLIVRVLVVRLIVRVLNRRSRRRRRTVRIITD